MKAEEIYRKWKGYNSEYHLTTSDLQNISAMKEYAFQFQSPSLSEEEIDEELNNTLSFMSAPPLTGVQLHFVKCAINHILSRLPHEQPVGKTDNLEAEQPQEECTHDYVKISQGGHKPMYCANCGKEL